MSEEISFKDEGKIEVPEKGNVIEEKMAATVRKKIMQENIDATIREEEGAEKVQPKGSFTKDVPQMAFKICAKLINCPKFELSDEEAQTFSTHLNIVLPISGKVASLVVLVMITMNKVLACMDAIQKRLAPKLEKTVEEPALPPQLL